MNLWTIAGIIGVVAVVRYMRGRPPGWPLIGARKPVTFNLGKTWNDQVIRAVDEGVAFCTGGKTGRRIERLAPERQVDALQNCIAREVFPDVPWPPVDGDHPSIHLAWGKLGMVAESIVEGDDEHEEIVGEAWTETAEEEEEEEDEDGVSPPHGPGTPSPGNRGTSMGRGPDDCSC